METEENVFVVYNEIDFVYAVSNDNGVDYVYLGADITLTDGVTIFPGKPSLIIDGQYEGVIHTLREMDSSAQNKTIHINAPSQIDLEFRNIVMTGRNYYGMPSVYNISGTEDVTITYRNVTYTGPQITWHTRGLTRYLDSDIVISPGYSPTHEVAEVGSVEIGGVTNIQHNSSTNAVFFFYRTTSSFTVLENANVSITSANDFLYGLYPVAMVIGQGAGFNLTTTNGISRSIGQPASTFLVDSNASFTYIRNTNGGSAVTLYLTGALTVNENARFYMQANFASTGALLRFSSSTGGIYLNNPASFVLYNAGTSSSGRALYFSTSIPFSITGGQLNYWLDACAFPTAGDFEDEPWRKWNRPTWDSFTIFGTAATSQTSVAGTTFSDQELAELPPLEDLQLHSARVISVGNLPLHVDPIRDDQRPVTGSTEPLAAVRIQYSVGPYGQQVDVTADPDGHFSASTPEVVPFQTFVTVSSNIPFLITSVVVASEEAGELSIEEAPEHIVFVVEPLEHPLYRLIPRKDYSDPVIVSDTRGDESTPWTLTVSASGPLTSAEGHVLPDSIVFVDEQGGVHDVGENPVAVYYGDPIYEPPTSVEIRWNYNDGILGRLSAPIYVREQYMATLTWTVFPNE